METLIPLLLSAMAGFGLFMMVASFAAPRSAFRRIQDTESGPRLLGMAEGTILQALLIDMSRKIKPEGEHLLDRLRRSGLIYASPAEFHTRRMYLALVQVALALGISFALELFFHVRLIPLGSALLATLVAVNGFTLPARVVNRAIRRRRERLLKEMGFGLDRIALFLRSGADIADALSQTRHIGLFGEICGRLASNLSMGRSILEATQEVSQELPRTPQFDELLGMVTVAIQKGQGLVEPFQIRAVAMRQRLKLEIVEEGNRARIKVILLTSVVILLASILVTILPTLILLTTEGIV
jgi:Flp pilus assembly protein TadB